jgi:hypothetical protein
MALRILRIPSRIRSNLTCLAEVKLFTQKQKNQGDLHPNYLVITYFDSKKKVETTTSLFSLKSVSQHYETTSNTTTTATAHPSNYETRLQLR